MKLPLLLGAAGAFALVTATGFSAEDFYVGTYTKGTSKGIYHFQFDEATGMISDGKLAATTSDPSFLVIHPNQRWLYADNEENKGTVSAFAIGPDRQLQLLSQQSSRGSGPCHVSLDISGHYVFVANYNNGSVAVLPIQDDGGVGAATGFDQHHDKGPRTDRQEGPHAHSIYADPANRYVYSCDLGNDRIEGYLFLPSKGTIEPNKTATTSIAGGSGPRHLVMHPRGFVYLLNEVNSTVTVLRRDAATGALQTLQTVPTLPKDYTQPNTTAEIALHPNGKFLYASNRGQDSIVVFAIAADGQLSPVEHVPTGGKTPRNFSLDPSGRWLLAANQDSNDIFVFGVNGDTGKLTATGHKVSVGSPVCVAFMTPK
jgi:6-phosphogluconolactonase